MRSKKKENVESSESDNEVTKSRNDKNKEESTDISTKLTKEEAKKFYEEKGIDLSHDVPIHSIPIPPFEKSMADKIVSKFGQKAVIDYVRPNRIRVNTKREDILDIAYFIRDELKFDHAESVGGVDYQDSKEIEVVYHLGSYTMNEKPLKCLGYILKDIQITEDYFCQKTGQIFHRFEKTSR